MFNVIINGKCIRSFTNEECAYDFIRTHTLNIFGEPIPMRTFEETPLPASVI